VCEVLVLSMSAKPTNARTLAFDVLVAVEGSQAYSNLLLPATFRTSQLSAEERRFATELVYGTLRRQGFYDRIIERVAGRALIKIDTSVLVCMRLGAHQLLTLEKPRHAIVNEMVDLAKKHIGKSVTGFINACLRKVAEKSSQQWVEYLSTDSANTVQRLSIEFAHPEWIIDEFEKSLSAHGRRNDIEALLTADNVNPTVTCVTLPGHSHAHEESDSTRYSPCGFSLKGGDPATVAGVAEGHVRVQDEGSQLAALALARVVPITAGEKWLDLCAGPGGKAALLSAEANLSGAHVTCNEINETRSRLVEQALAPFSNVTVTTSDGRDWGTTNPLEFDRIMLDAPCSGLGSLRRRPESRWRKTPADVEALVPLQRELLDSAVAALKPGGYIAYVTCTPVLTETEEIVQQCLKAHPDLIQVDAWGALASVATNPLPRSGSSKAVQLWPHIHGTDAMFISLLRKKA